MQSWVTPRLVPVSSDKIFILIILFEKPLKYHDWSLVTSLYSHDIILVLFSCIIKQDYNNNNNFSHWRLDPV